MPGHPSTPRGEATLRRILDAAAEEFALRKQVRMLQTRLEMKGKRVTTISLAECLDTAMRATRPCLS